MNIKKINEGTCGICYRKASYFCEMFGVNKKGNEFEVSIKVCTKCFKEIKDSLNRVDKGFFGEDRTICEELNNFYDNYYKALIITFPDLSGKHFNSFEDMINFKDSDEHTKVNWHFGASDLLDKIKKVHIIIDTLSKIDVKCVKRIFDYESIMLELIERSCDENENVEVLLDSITGLRIHALYAFTESVKIKK